ncbi:hypothetical protein ACHAWF_002555 [Thalassiosira exigua]
MAASSDDGGDFVTVHLPGDEEGAFPRPDVPVGSVGGRDARGGDGGDDDDDPRRSSSLLRSLWTEAASTTDLPSPGSDRRLHHRRGAASSAASSYGGGEGGGGSRDALSSPSKGPSKGRRRPRGPGRGAGVAKRVWLAAFAALGAALLISIHVFLYRVATKSDGGGGRAGPESPQKAAGRSGVRGPGSKQARARQREERTGAGGTKNAVLKDGVPILGVEDLEARMTMAEARAHELAPIAHHSIDTSRYTIRINTWRRNEQLLLSLNHHAKCPGVAEIQVVWCDGANDPPREATHHPSGKVKVERHEINSLNERFKVLIDPPTLGILSLDDDVLRPCAALDAGFVRWTRHPDRMVGFDARRHVEETVAVEEGLGRERRMWKYGYMSTTEKTNRYTLSLPRAAFLHRDYLDVYTVALPRSAYAYVAENLECEDIAMSFLVSSLTDGKPPLLADHWAVKSMVKLYSEKRISGGSGHKSARDKCVDDFAQVLGLKKSGLQKGVLSHNGHFFWYGDRPEDWDDVDPEEVGDERLEDLVEELRDLGKKGEDKQRAWLGKMMAETMVEARKAGMIEKTKEWKERWGAKG